MKHTKAFLPMILCVLMLLAGCGDKSQTATLAPAQEPEEEDLSGSIGLPELDKKQKWLSYLSLQDGFHISDYGESLGENYSFAVYQISNEKNGYERTALYWEIVVIQDNSVIMVLPVNDEEHGDAFPVPSKMITEMDVNFDGKNDILVCLGHFGNQGSVAYKCFLATERGLIHCPSFTEIANPSVDDTNQVVLSQYRNSATSHSWSVFEFIDHEFRETQRLTEKAIYQSDTLIWSFQEEVFLDGEWQTREYFTEEDYDTETIQSKLYGSESYWGLDQEKWNSLYNQ